MAPTDVADLLLPEVEEVVPDTPLHTAVLSAMDGGALFFRQLVDRTGAVLLDGGAEAPSDADVVAALWDLVWAGLVTNDTIAPLRALVSGPRRGAQAAQLRAARPVRPAARRPPGDAEPDGSADGRRPLVAGHRRASRTRRGGRTPGRRRSWSGTAC